MVENSTRGLSFQRSLVVTVVPNSVCSSVFQIPSVHTLHFLTVCHLVSLVALQAKEVYFFFLKPTASFFATYTQTAFSTPTTKTSSPVLMSVAIRRTHWLTGQAVGGSVGVIVQHVEEIHFFPQRHWFLLYCSVSVSVTSPKSNTLCR